MHGDCSLGDGSLRLNPEESRYFADCSLFWWNGTHLNPSHFPKHGQICIMSACKRIDMYLWYLIWAYFHRMCKGCPSALLWRVWEHVCMCTCMYICVSPLPVTMCLNTPCVTHAKRNTYTNASINIVWKRSMWRLHREIIIRWYSRLI